MTGVGATLVVARERNGHGLFEVFVFSHNLTQIISTQLT